MYDGLIDTLKDLVYQYKITPKEFENLVLSLYGESGFNPNAELLAWCRVYYSRYKTPKLPKFWLDDENED